MLGTLQTICTSCDKPIKNECSFCGEPLLEAKELNTGMIVCRQETNEHFCKMCFEMFKYER